MSFLRFVAIRLLTWPLWLLFWLFSSGWSISSGCVLSLQSFHHCKNKTK